MRISFIIYTVLITTSAIVRADPGHAQVLETRISIAFKNTTVHEIILGIQQQAGIEFAYMGKLNLDEYTVAEFSCDNQTVESVLRRLLRGKEIAIREKKGVVLLIPRQQPRTVTGRILDESGNALPGVTIVVKSNPAFGTSSLQDGSFSMQVPKDAEALVVSFLGYQTREVPINQTNALTISLAPDARQLEGVVVTALGIERERKSLGYRIDKVDNRSLVTVPQENLLTALAGKVPGLKISNTVGDINAETDVYIRGLTSLTGNNVPLVVINGIPAGTPTIISDLNPENIAEISVLKGPGAAALYGSRAGNGVILIQTKSGKDRERGIGIQVNTSAVFTEPYRFIDLQHRFTSGRRGELDEAAHQHWYGPEAGTEAIQWDTDGEARPLRMHDNALRDFFETGFSTINDLSIDGAGDRGNFHLNLSQLSATGTYPGTELRRIGVSGNFAYNLTKRLKVSGHLDIINPQSDNYPVQAHDDYQYVDIYMVPPHVDINDMKDYWAVENEQQRNIASSYSNPWFIANERIKRFERQRGLGNLRLDWQVLPQLDLMLRYAQNQNYTKNEVLDPWSTVLTNPKPRGGYSQQVSKTKEENADFLLAYTLPRQTSFSLKASVGGNLMRQWNSNMLAGGDNLIIPGLFTLSNVDRNGLDYANQLQRKAIYSLYGLATFGYRDVAFLDVSARNDWSSTLPVSNRSYFYPSASLSLLVSEMINRPDWLSLLKLRGGWARVGKDTDPYQLESILNQSNWGDLTLYSVPSQLANSQLKPEIATSVEGGFDVALLQNRLGFDLTLYQVQNRNQILSVATPGMSGYSSANINAGNVRNRGMEMNLWATPVRSADVSWDVNVNFTRERSRLMELDPGMEDFQFWNNTGVRALTRVGEELGDMYSNDILRVNEGPYKGWPLLDANGKLQTSTNLKKVGNYTHDFMVGFQTSFRYKRFSLAASFDWRQGGDFYSITMMRLGRGGKVEDWNNGISSSTFSGILGAHSFGSPAALAEEIRNHPEIYRDHNVWIGGRNEELGGFPYNGLYNGAFFPGVRSDGNGGYIENFGDEGTEYINAYEVIEPGGGYWGLGVEDKWIYDASFLKLRELSLSYDLPASLTGRIKAQQITVSAFTRNILLWTAAKINMDPEYAYLRTPSGMNQGVDRWNGAPMTFPVGFRLKATF